MIVSNSAHDMIRKIHDHDPHTHPLRCYVVKSIHQCDCEANPRPEPGPARSNGGGVDSGECEYDLCMYEWI